MSKLESLSPADVARLRANPELWVLVRDVADRTPVEVRVVDGDMPTVEVDRRGWRRLWRKVS